MANTKVFNPFTRKHDFVRDSITDLGTKGHDLLDNLDFGSAGHTGNLEISKADPEIKLTDTGDSNNTRVIRSDTLAKAIRYNTVFKPTGVGNCLNLNGSSEWIKVADNVLLSFSNFSLIIWFNSASLPTNADVDHFFYKDYEYYFRLSNNVNQANGLVLDVGIYAGGAFNRFFSTKNSWNTSQWYLAAVTYDGANVRIYVDGAVDSTQAAVLAMSNTAYDLSIGQATPHNVEYFNGKLDNPLIYNKALSANDISDLWNGGSAFYPDPDGTFPTDGGDIDDGLVLNQPFDESVMNSAPGGTDTEDISGNNLHGTAEGGMVDGDFVEGKVNKGGGDTEIVVWQHQDGVNALEGGILTIGDASHSPRIILDFQTLRFNIAGVEKAQITNAGLFGINESAPDAMLEVVTNATTEEGLHIKGSASQTADLQVWTDSADAIMLRVQADGDLEFNDGVDLIFGTTTGTKIGMAVTQKIGFWNATPVVQEPTIVDADGTLADITTKYNTLLASLETIGILAAA